MVNVEYFIVFCSSRLGRVLVISIRQFAKAYPPIYESLSADLRKPIRQFAKAYLPICEGLSADLRKPIRRFAKAYLPICESLSADLQKPICRFAKSAAKLYHFLRITMLWQRILTSHPTERVAY